jgi:hypothetical protein
LPMAQNDALCAKAGCKSILTRTMHIGGTACVCAARIRNGT